VSLELTYMPKKSSILPSGEAELFEEKHEAMGMDSDYGISISTPAN